MSNTRRKPKPTAIKIVGLILSGRYQRSKLFAKQLHKHYPKKFLPPSITGMLEMDWVDYLQKLRREQGGKTWALKDSVVFLNDSFLGGEEEFFNHFGDYFYKRPKPEKVKESAEEEYKRYLNKENLIYIYMDLGLDGDYMGTLLFQLRHDWLPKSSLWFTEFCTHGTFNYIGSPILRVCKRGWFQAGEIKELKSMTLLSRCLQDENYCYKHDRRGVLSFANDGKNTNKHQFMVTFEAARWMDGKYVAFGRVVEGSDVLRRIENTPCTYEKPDREILIINCGMAEVGLGRAIDPALKVKGITVGEPHIHLEFFTDMLFERFDQLLFERLDEEVKKMIGGEWIREMLWNKVVDEIMKKRPSGDDVLDERDQSSKVYVAVRYLAGLYSLPDMPDLYIIALLEEAIAKALEISDVTSMAKSIVNLLVNSAINEVTMTEQIVEDLVESLIKKVLKVIFGSEVSTGILATESESSMSIMKTISDVSLYDLTKKYGLDEKSIHTLRTLQTLHSELTTPESVLGFIWSAMLENLSRKNLSV